MSRSHKKNFITKDRNPYIKRYANRCVRRALNNDFNLELQHNSYRKFYESYDICDWKFRESWEEYWAVTLRIYERLSLTYPNREIEFPDKEQEYRWWRQSYYNK